MSYPFVIGVMVAVLFLINSVAGTVSSLGERKSSITAFATPLPPIVLYSIVNES